MAHYLPSNRNAGKSGSKTLSVVGPEMPSLALLVAGVHETQVSRDERNAYHGTTLERATKTLEALGVEVRSRVERVEQQPAEVA